MAIIYGDSVVGYIDKVYGLVQCTCMMVLPDVIVLIFVAT